MSSGTAIPRSDIPATILRELDRAEKLAGDMSQSFRSGNLARGYEEQREFRAVMATIFRLTALLSPDDQSPDLPQ